MASLLRSIVASPRSRHPEAGLDLCYVTDNIIATSGPSSTYPQRAYRNPTDALVKFLDYKHGSKWAIWEFRAEGTGYPDSEVYHRIKHFPWPDHHPPPFALIPNIMASMRDWLKGPGSEKGRTVVVHCKAGKGRSGTSACSYLVSEEGWTVEDALARFTSRRMRSGFGSGVSIPSQLRWVGYVDWWAKHEKVYIERQIRIIEIHVWGLRDGVKVAIAGYVEEGKVIKTFHTFDSKERIIMNGEVQSRTNTARVPDHNNEKALPLRNSNVQADQTHLPSVYSKSHEPGADAILFRSQRPIILPSSDINIDFERRNKATYGLTMVTSVAHVWFNAFFEAQYSQSQPDHDVPSVTEMNPPNRDTLPDSGVFQIDWEAMDGIKGSARKGTRALDRLAVVWQAIPESKDRLSKIITEPGVGQPVSETQAADWKSTNLKSTAERLGKDLGLRVESPSSANVSKASSTTDLRYAATEEPGSDIEAQIGVKTHGPEGGAHIPPPDQAVVSTSEPSSVDHSLLSSAHSATPEIDLGIEKMHSPILDPDIKAATTEDLPGQSKQLH